MALKRNRNAWRDDLSRVTWQDFERVLAGYYRDLGFDVEHCGTGAGGQRYDGGVDLVLRREGETVLVQVKHWNAKQVPHNDVHQLLGVVETRGATRAILITSGEFTAAARDWASRTPRIELIDGGDLRRLIDPRLIPAPEPAPPPGVSHADLMTWQPVVEKTVDAVIDVMAGRRLGRRRRTVGEELTSGLLKLAAFVVMLAVVVVFLRYQMEKVTASLTPPPRPERVVAAPAAMPPQQSAPSPTTRQPPPPANGMQRMTEEELAEWERKNAESMEILRRTTKELAD